MATLHIEENDLFTYFNVNEHDWANTPESIKCAFRKTALGFLSETEFWALKRDYPKIYRRFADAQGWKD